MKFHIVAKDSRLPVLDLKPSEILRAFVPPGQENRFDLVMVKETLQAFPVTDGSVLSHATVDMINEPDDDLQKIHRAAAAGGLVPAPAR